MYVCVCVCVCNMLRPVSFQGVFNMFVCMCMCVCGVCVCLCTRMLCVYVYIKVNLCVRVHVCAHVGAMCLVSFKSGGQLKFSRGGACACVLLCRLPLQTAPSCCVDSHVLSLCAYVVLS